MIRSFWQPANMIKHMKRYSYPMSLIYLLITSVLLFFTAKIAGLAWIQSLYVLLGIIVTLLLGSFVLNLILWVWGKNNYLLALNTLVLPWFIFSAGALVIAVLNLIPTAGPILAGLVAMLVIPFAISIQLKMMIENFRLDTVTAFILLLILFVGAGTSIMGIVSGLALQLIANLGFGLLPIAFP